MAAYALIPLVLLACTLPRAKERSGDAERCLSLRRSDYEAGFHCLEQIVISKVQPPREKEKAFSSLIQSWNQRDGAAGFTLSDIFLAILSADYRFFFSQMKKYPEEYNSWLSEVGNLSFVGIEYFALEEKRKDLIARLEGISDLNKDTDPLRIRLTNVLKQIVPEQI
jgi:hypothetical protein